MSTRRLLLALVLLAGCFTLGPVLGAAEDEKKPVTSKEAAAEKEKFARFQKEMTGTKLVGQFTVVGQPQGALAKEEYTIRSISKLQGDYWLLTARIKYGGRDLTLPVPLKIVWAGDTPVITLTKAAIPGLGTFSCRVVIYNKKYAGTWTHGEVGGHLFGTLEKVKADGPKKPEKSPDK
jgi:hypothetical protein